MARLVLAVAVALAACSSSEPREVVTSSAKDPQVAKRWIAAGAVVIDVRTTDEYATGHLDHAVNIPVQELGGRLAEVDKLVAGDKRRPIVVYCAAGGRAATAKKQLDAAGYRHVVNGGGYSDLKSRPG